MTPAAPVPAPEDTHTDALSETLHHLRTLQAVSRVLADQIDHLTAQLAEAHLRILFIFETFTFTQKSALLDASGQPSVIRTTLGELYRRRRDTLVQTLEEMRKETPHGEGVPPVNDAPREAEDCLTASSTSASTTPRDADRTHDAAPRACASLDADAVDGHAATCS